MKILAVLALSGALVQAEPRIAFLRVHGNHTIPDDEVLRLAGVALGEPFAAGDDGRVQDRLMKSGKFETVDVRIRYRSLTETADVALVLLVREKRSIASRFMVGPIFDWTDEYRLTIGARLAMVDLAGGQGSVAFPLSWGGKRQVGVEGRFGDARVNFSRWRQVNPHFDTPDNRLELGGAYTVRRDQLRFEMLAEWSDVDFGALRERFTTFGARAVFDTRRDPTVPGNAVYLGVDWRRLIFSDRLDGSDRPNVNRFTFDLRGYKRLWGQAVLASQFLWMPADGPLPPYEKPFIGGGQTLRGYEPGIFIGDNAALGTVELRQPLTSPLSFVRAGVHAFYDTGAVYDDGESLGGTRFHHGLGMGVFLRAAIIGVRMDVGWDLEGGSRFHIASSMKF